MNEDLFQEAFRACRAIVGNRILVDIEEIDRVINNLRYIPKYNNGKIDFERLKDELLSIYTTTVDTYQILEGRERREPWIRTFHAERQSEWFFWKRYQKYLEEEKNFNLSVQPNETIALVGNSGGGKSTVVNLIPRFYDVTSGDLLVDGVNVKDLSQKELREVIGFVPQKGMLFSGTIESNIKYSNQEMSDERMKQAAEIAQAVEFIEEKEAKYKSEIAQGGANVSGGQKQRLSIARAIAKDPEIFVFDDSFSALDFKTDATLREALAKRTKNKTNIIVAQRISTILNADKIIVLEDGKIVGQGTHEELIKDNETYREIALSQLSEEELNKMEGGE